jgi:UDP-glucose 4-epimerase
MSKTVILTGATGFTGRYITEEGISRGYKIIVLSRPSSDIFAFKKNNIPVYTVDTANPEKLTEVLRTIKAEHGIPEIIIHNAGLTKAFEKEKYFEVNTSFTASFIDAIKEAEIIPEKFIYTSSLAAAGPGDEKTMQAIKEDKFPEPVTAYGKSKLAAEKIIRGDHIIPWVILRPTAVYGPEDKDGLLLYKTISKGFEFYTSRKKQYISFIYARDFASACFTIAEKGEIKNIYNISDGKNITVKEFNGLIKKELKRKTIKIYLPPAVLSLAAAISERAGKRKGRLTIFNIDKVNELKALNWKTDNGKLENLGFIPGTGLETGITQTAKWYKENGWL